MTETQITIQAGEPFAQAIRVVDAVDIWPTLDDFEVRSQVKDSLSTRAVLLTDLSAFLTPTIDDNDIVITLSMTGEETRAVRSGHYDMFISDPGATDVRAIRILHGRVVVTAAVTDPS